MQSRNTLLIIITVAVMGYFFFKDKKTKVNEVEEDDTEVSEAVRPVKSTLSVSGTTTAVSTDQSKVAAAMAAPVVQTAPVNEAILKRFASQMQSMQACLGLANPASVGDSLNPTPDNLIGVLRPSLGDSVVQLDDWAQFDVMGKDNIKKRVRVDFDYPDGATPNRRLSMYTVNAYGALEIMNLTDDQSDNPNVAFIESFKEDAQVLMNERSARIYFAQGEELVFTVKNDQLYSINIAKGDRAFNCSGLDTENGRCSCP